jgi:hypothetical protein
MLEIRTIALLSRMQIYRLHIKYFISSPLPNRYIFLVIHLNIIQFISKFIPLFYGDRREDYLELDDPSFIHNLPH